MSVGAQTYERPRRCAVVLASAVLIAGCSGQPQASPTTKTATPGSATRTAVSATTPSAQDGVLEHYEAFFEALPRASRLPEGERNQLLRRYLSGRAYGAVVETLSSQEEFGKALYGQPILKPKVASIGAQRALIRDCQNTSESGVQDVKSGRKETKGVPRTLVVTDLKRVENSWKITRIDYRGPGC